IQKGNGIIFGDYGKNVASQQKPISFTIITKDYSITFLNRNCKYFTSHNDDEIIVDWSDNFSMTLTEKCSSFCKKL
ncbi:hypothetical protein, partial [Okeania sp. SIO2B9]|uniref:hypothetical protein n=1 Tax=Okeania sp. SIO2B9 TaxID=2607782 RepID=UPI0014295C51